MILGFYLNEAFNLEITDCQSRISVVSIVMKMLMEMILVDEYGDGFE